MTRPVPRRLAGILALTLLIGCSPVSEALDTQRIKLFGKTVSEPAPESREWVVMEAMNAARDSNAERGWERFQKLLHSDARTPNGLRSWYRDAWPRMRRQVGHYDVHGDGSYELVGLDKQVRGDGETAGFDLYIQSSKKEMPTPCSVYVDAGQGGKWRIKRCSL